MSKETSEWLNNNVLVGFTDNRGTAWHYRQGADNHYTGAIPIEDVKSRLFNWAPVSSPIYVESGDSFIPVPDKQAIMRSDTGHVMGLFSDGYEPHDYNEWLLTNVGNMLDDKLNIGSAGLLKRGAVAWVQIEMSDNVTTPSGVEYRPSLLATTSFDGSVATTYKRVSTLVVCDNTLSMALSAKTSQVRKTRHTKNSKMKLTEARDTLGIMFEMSEEINDGIAELTETKVSEIEWDLFLSELTKPTVAAGKTEPTKNAITLAEKRRDVMQTLWDSDERVSPWKGTLFGILQADNTYRQHEAATRGDTGRVERNMLNAIAGKTEEADSAVLELARKVLVPA